MPKKDVIVQELEEEIEKLLAELKERNQETEKLQISLREHKDEILHLKGIIEGLERTQAIQRPTTYLPVVPPPTPDPCPGEPWRPSRCPPITW